MSASVSLPLCSATAEQGGAGALQGLGIRRLLRNDEQTTGQGCGGRGSGVGVIRGGSLLSQRQPSMSVVLHCFRRLSGPLRLLRVVLVFVIVLDGNRMQGLTWVKRWRFVGIPSQRAQWWLSQDD